MGSRIFQVHLDFFSPLCKKYILENLISILRNHTFAFCSGVISPDSALTKQYSQTPGLIAVWYLSAGIVDVKDRKLLFTLDSFALSSSHRLSKWRKTQPVLEQNVLVETTDLH